MKRFEEYIKESITDKMTPKTDEEISQATMNTVLSTYPNAKNKHNELTECVNLLIGNGYYYSGINIEDSLNNRPNENREKDVVWFKYKEPEHYLSITDDTKIENLKKRIDNYQKRYEISK